MTGNNDPAPWVWPLNGHRAPIPGEGILRDLYRYEPRPEYDTNDAGEQSMSQSYGEHLAATLTGLHPESQVIGLHTGIPVESTELLDALNRALKDNDDSEMFIEIDRQVIAELERRISRCANVAEAARQVTFLLPYLYPAAVRIDEVGDIIIHVTDADRAQQEIES